MKTLLLPLLSLLSTSSALTGSHVQVSIGGSTYTHGKKVGLPEAAYHAAPPPPKPIAPYHAAPVPAPAPASHPMPMDDMKMMDEMDMPMDDMKMGMEDMPMPGHYMPSPSPAYHVTPAPAYHVTPTYQAHPEPAYKAHPKPVYHSKLAYAPVVHHNTYHPTPAYHHAPVPSYHHAPAPGYHAPKHDCSIVIEMEKVEVCTPAFETKCMNVDLMVKRIVDKEQCQDITRTVCVESMETIPNEICTYTYMAHTEDSVARTVDISFEKNCMTQMVTVCQPKAGYGYHSYGHQYCKEVSQETCYNVPKVMPVDVPVMVTYPEPMKECVNKPITLPRVTCEDIMEKKCIVVPEIMDDIEMVEKCETMLAAPKCQILELSLPKQVCVELVYGQSYEEGYHAKI